jgi:hypothetical protein
MCTKTHATSLATKASNLSEWGLSDRILFGNGFMLRLFILIYGPQSKPQILFARPSHYLVYHKSLLYISLQTGTISKDHIFI